MNPRIEKKLSKRLVQIAPKLCSGYWIDDQPDQLSSQKHWKSSLKRELTAREKKENNLALRNSVRHVCSIGGEYCSYSGDCNESWTCFGYLRDNWMWVGNFPASNEEGGWPDTGKFKPTTRNLLKLARDHG